MLSFSSIEFFKSQFKFEIFSTSFDKLSNSSFNFFFESLSESISLELLFFSLINEDTLSLREFISFLSFSFSFINEDIFSLRSSFFFGVYNYPYLNCFFVISYLFSTLISPG